MSESTRRSSSIRNAVRHTLISSAACLPACLIAPLAHGQAAPTRPTANAGADLSIKDTDGRFGESVTLQGSGASTNANGGPLSFVWTTPDQAVIATGATPTVTLPDGVNQLLLTVTDSCCQSSSALSATDMVTITVRPRVYSNPTVDAGPDRTIADTNGEPGESVTLQGSGSTSVINGGPLSFVWLDAQGEEVATGATPTIDLPDGVHELTLMARDNCCSSAGTLVSTDTVIVTVGEPAPRPTLSEIALTKHQKAVARTLDDLCARLEDETEGPGEAAGLPQFVQQKLSATRAAAEVDVDDLAARCAGILSDPSIANKRAALDALGAQEFNAMRTPAVVFSQTQFQSVMDRLVALRAGQRGTSLAGLNMQIGDQFVSLEELAQSLRHAFGSGASADAADGGLLEDRLGFWMRGNYGVGEKAAGDAGIGFESDQWGLSGGADYRFANAAIVGVALGYGKSNIDFDPTSQGAIDTRSLAASIYASGYVGALYLDAVFNYIDTDYDSARRIAYSEDTTAIDRTALGTTGGETISGGAAIGYDLTVGAFTFAPSIGYYYVDTGIDSFEERNAGGLNLAFDEQQYQSSAANASVRASYAWKTSWGVFIPHFRGAFVREFEDSADVFGVRFASDPFAGSANPTPPIIIESDRIDRSYLRLAAGASAQFAFGIAGYVEYQRLEGYEQVKFHDFTVGLRIQRGF